MARNERSMGTCVKDAPRRCQQRRRSRTLTAPARVLGPVGTTLVAQLTVVLVAVIVGLPALLTLALVVGVGVLAAILARRTVASLVAGASIRVAQPYATGERIRLYVPSLDSVHEAEIVRVGAANTTVLTDAGVVVVPNAQMLLGARR